MARTKRKQNPLFPEPVKEPLMQNVYRTAGYVRLSIKDGGKHETDIIEVQKELIVRYIEEQPDMELINLYCDNGLSGTNFQRPQFERLMEDVKSGTINCIVVKDLSRFGRNYQEAGNYLERIFPFLGVRFVAITDHFDTLTAGWDNNDCIVALKNIINEAYSRDISKKVSSGKAARQRKGEFVGTWPAYGYRKCADDPYRIEPDPQTAPVIRDIFLWRLSGMGYMQIARKLNVQGIPAPSRYHYLKGDAKCEKYANVLWSSTVVNRLLNNEVYLGHMVQGRRRDSFYEGNRRRVRPESEWIVVRNTHEPLIDEDTFFAVRELGEERKAAYKEKLGKNDGLCNTPNILKGLLYCEHCKRHLMRSKICARGKVRYVYTCRSHLQNPKECSVKNIPEIEVLEVLWDVLRKQFELAKCISEEMRNFQFLDKPFCTDLKLNDKIDSAARKLKRAQELYGNLYLSYAVDKLLSEQEYLQLKKKYQMQIEEAQKELEAAEEKKKSSVLQTAENPWMKACIKLWGETQLTEKMAHMHLSHVEINADHKISVTVRFQDEYRQLVEYLGQREDVLS